MKDKSADPSGRSLGENPSHLQSHEVLQPFPDTCAIRSQEIIIREFGYNTDHNHLVEQAIELGAYEPGTGTHAEDVGKLFDLYGIKYHPNVDSNIFDITKELAQAHKVIVGLNSEQLLQHGLYDAADFLDTHEANHTLIVAGIDFSDADHVIVHLKDPGTGDVAKSYPLETFIEAWKDSECFMVSTDEPPQPKLDLPELRYFNDKVGHLEKIGELPYEEFSEVYERLNEINFERVSNWNDLCDTFSKVVNGEEPVEALQDSVDHYLEVYHESQHSTEETLSDFNSEHGLDDEHAGDEIDEYLPEDVHNEEDTPFHHDHSDDDTPNDFNYYGQEDPLGK